MSPSSKDGLASTKSYKYNQTNPTVLNIQGWSHCAKVPYEFKFVNVNCLMFPLKLWLSPSSLTLRSSPEFNGRVRQHRHRKQFGLGIEGGGRCAQSMCKDSHLNRSIRLFICECIPWPRRAFITNGQWSVAIEIIRNSGHVLGAVGYIHKIHPIKLQWPKCIYDISATKPRNILATMVNLYLYIRHILFWHICWQRFAIAALFSQIKHIGISMISKKTVAEYVVLVCFGQAAHSGHSTEAHREQSCMADNIANLGGLNPGVVTNGIGWWLSTVMAITHPTCNMYLFYPCLIFSFNACKPTPRSIVPVSVICCQNFQATKIELFCWLPFTFHLILKTYNRIRRSVFDHVCTYLLLCHSFSAAKTRKQQRPSREDLTFATSYAVAASIPTEK